MNSNVKQRVVKVIADVLNRKESEIGLNASLRQELQATSIDRLTLFVALEDEFQRSLPPEEVEVADIETVNDIVDFIENKLQQAP